MLANLQVQWIQSPTIFSRQMFDKYHLRRVTSRAVVNVLCSSRQVLASFFASFNVVLESCVCYRSFSLSASVSASRFETLRTRWRRAASSSPTAILICWNELNRFSFLLDFKNDTFLIGLLSASLSTYSSFHYIEGDEQQNWQIVKRSWNVAMHVLLWYFISDPYLHL